jgi:carbonic anhydrase/acetyltransferase-like protein (isoleucine patch superfamily)
VAILPFESAVPLLASDCFVAPGASVIGDVHLGARSSVWFGAVIRGDVFHIRIGRETNVQDLSVIHVTTGLEPTLIGDRVTIGHRVILHGCTVGDGALIGMGAIVMDRAVIGPRALVAAGSLVSEGTEIPPETLAMGAPARVKRKLSAGEIARIEESAVHYAELAAQYAARIGWGADGSRRA